MDLAKCHQAAKIIETDGVGGYWTCRERFGKEIADVLIVALLRKVYNPDEQWPAPDGLAEKVNEQLEKEGLVANGEFFNGNQQWI